MASMLEAEYWTIANPDWVWIIVVGFLIAFVLAFGIGANDVANSFGSSVGAKVLTLRQACILGAIFETLGSVLIGARVSNTIRKGIITVDSYGNGTEQEFMLGNLAAITGSCVWMIVASLLSLPVSATHSIVGATLGFSLVAKGTEGVSWTTLGMIVGSWFVSPVFSGLISTALFFLLYKKVLTQKNPLKEGLKFLPLFYGLTIAVNLFSVFYKGSELLHFNKIPLYGTFILTFGPAIIGAILVRLLIVPWQRETITRNCSFVIKEEGVLVENFEKELSKPQHTSTPLKKADLNGQFNGHARQAVDVEQMETLLEHQDTNIDIDGALHSKGNLSTNSKVPLVQNESPDRSPSGTTSSSSVTSEPSLTEEEVREIARGKIKDTPETASLFSFLQILTAVFGSFAHGGNDVSNAIGPLVALWITAQTGETAQEAPVPIFILLLGGLGMSVGLFVMGRRVMKTMGEDLTRITPSSGFSIEVGSAATVLVASNIGIPISTTHCKVGSIVFVGWFRSREGVDWKLFRNIVIAWFVTLPIAGGLSAAVMAIFKAVV
uniref:Phosphate transporter n=1 Tax=Tridacna squamosa TaxID=80830 RepID=A0A7S6KUL9_TRISQ|nr:Inorganic phosphate transporter 1-like protein [Tridacna squamosa]